MTSLLSVLSLLILVLANGYFAVPIVDEPTSTTSSHVGLTTDHGVQLQFVTDGETSTLSFPQHTATTGQSTEETMTTSIIGKFGEQFSRLSKLFDEAATNKTTTVTTERSPLEGHVSTDLPSTTFESSTNVLEQHPRELEDENESESHSESKREHHEEENDDQSESDAAKRDVLVETSTLSMSSFTSTSSAIAPHLYTTESTTTTTTPSSRLEKSETSTEKYTGLLKDDDEETKQPTKPIKKQPKKPKVSSEDKLEEESKDKSNEDVKVKQSKKPKIASEDKSEEESKVKQPKKPKVTSEDKSEEESKIKKPKKPKFEDDDDSKDSSVPTAVFDQEALKDVATMPSGVMVIDESTDLVVTDIPEKLVKMKTEQKEKAKQLNQGKKSSHSEKEESDN